MILSILIPTTPDRRPMFNRLLDKLSLQAADIEGVEILHCEDDYKMTIGAKRNHLISEAGGEYVVFIDSDDDVADTYIVDIMAALESRPDCVGFRGYMTTNGKDRKNFAISRAYKTWHIENGIYCRHINHLCPVRRSIALKCPFPNLRHGEDYKYSMDLIPHLKTEVYIDKYLYIYKYLTHK
jgi:glycosyltransferase involved in cell wall biosynthesis